MCIYIYIYIYICISILICVCLYAFFSDAACELERSPAACKAKDMCYS